MIIAKSDGFPEGWRGGGGINFRVILTRIRPAPNQVAYVQQAIRRIAALLLLGPELNENYRRVKANAYPWQRLG